MTFMYTESACARCAPTGSGTFTISAERVNVPEVVTIGVVGKDDAASNWP